MTSTKSASAAETIKVSGTLQLKDDYNQAIHALTGIKVYVYTMNTLGTPYKRLVLTTDANGHFNGVIDNTKKRIKQEHSIFIKYITESDNIRVCQNGGSTTLTTYCVKCEPQNIGNKKAFTFTSSLPTKNGYTGKAFYIFMMLNAAALYVKEYIKIKPDFVTCNYPGTVSHTHQSWAEFNRIHLYSGDYNNTTVLHEYAHCLQNMLGFKYSGDLPGFHHASDYDITGKYSKEKGIYTAFFEAFADVFRACVINTYCNSLLSNYAICTLEHVNAYVTRGIRHGKGEGYENSCISTMLGLLIDKYDVLSQLSNEPTYYKKISKSTITFSEMANLFKETCKTGFSGCPSLYAFNKIMEEKYKGKPILEAYHYLLSESKCAPHHFSLNATAQSYTIDFKPGGNKEKENWGNEQEPNWGNECQTLQKKFKYKLYNSKGDVIKTVDLGSKKSFTIDKLTYEAAGGKKFYVSVCGYADHRYWPTGWYESGKIELEALAPDKDKNTRNMQSKLKTATTTDTKKTHANSPAGSIAKAKDTTQSTINKKVTVRKKAVTAKKAVDTKKKTNTPVADASGSKNKPELLVRKDIKKATDNIAHTINKIKNRGQ